MRPSLIVAVLTLAAALPAAGPQSYSPAPGPLRDRVQTYMDEWRAAASFPGAAVGIVLGQRAWFARLPNGKDITVRQLMTHTSGLVRYEMNPKFTADLRAQPDKVWSPDEHAPELGVSLAIQINTSAPRATGPRSLLRGLYDIAAMVKGV